MSHFLIHILWLGILSSSPTWARTEPCSGPPIDVVFDMHWTLINPVSPESARIKSDGIVKQGDRLFRFSEHLIDSLLLLHQNPCFRVSYFSSATQSENSQVLDEIYKLLNAHPKKQSLDPISPRFIWNTEELKSTDAPPSRPFHDRFQKDVFSLDRSLDPKRTLIVEDLREFVPEPQRGNVLWLGKTYEDIPDYIHWKQNRAAYGFDPKYEPPSVTAWKSSQEKIPRTVAILERAQLMADAPNSGMTFVEAAQKLNARALASHDEAARLASSVIERVKRLVPYVPCTMRFELNRYAEKVREYSTR